MRILLIGTILLGWSGVGLSAERTSAPSEARAYIIAPANGEVVGESFVVKFGLHGMGVAPAGVNKPNTGHFHLIVDGSLPDLNHPMGKQVRHFGGGQTETRLKLKPGTHTLQLIMGDARHIPHQPAVISEPVRITVEE